MNLGIALPPRLPQAPLRVNSGGPMSRRRTQAVQATLLGRREGPIFCPRMLTLALAFGEADPVAHMMGLLDAVGLTNPEELRALFEPPPTLLLVQPNPQLHPLDVHEAPREEVLRQGLLLGLCTAVLYDPCRPVLWTSASLTRRVELFETAGFYA